MSLEGFMHNVFKHCTSLLAAAALCAIVAAACEEEVRSRSA